MTRESQVKPDPFILKRLILNIKLYSISVTCLYGASWHAMGHASHLTHSYWSEVSGDDNPMQIAGIFLHVSMAELSEDIEVWDIGMPA